MNNNQTGGFRVGILDELELVEKKPSQGSLAFRIYRGIRKCYHLILPKSYKRSFTRGGIRFCINKLGFHSLILNGDCERRQANYLFTTAKEKQCDIFLDIGSNFGYYSLIGAKIGMFTEMHAFEPHPQTYRLLTDHIERNAFNSIIIPHNFAASDQDREMFIDKKSSTNASVSVDKRQETIAIKATTLDAVLDFVGRRIAIKLDVEGHQISALKGMKNLLTRNAVLLQVEIWGCPTESMEYLISNGFSCIYHIGDDFHFVNNKWDKLENE